MEYQPNKAAGVRKTGAKPGFSNFQTNIPRGWRTLAARLGCSTINTDHRRLNPRLVREIRAAGYPLLAYTVNDPRRARALFDWGVTSVFSDVPDIILPVSVEDPVRRMAAGLHSSDALRQGAIW